MFNKIILVGNLTRDVEIRYTGANLAIETTGIAAVNRKFKSQTGESKEETLFVDLSLFGRTAEIANQYLKKGSKVLVEGKLRLDQWVDQSGQKRSKHDITVEVLQILDTKKEREKLDSVKDVKSDNKVQHDLLNNGTNKEKTSELFYDEWDIPF